MFDWLFEGRLTVYLFLAVPALISLGLWSRDRRKHWLILVGSLAVLAGVYFLLDRVVETRDEQIARKLGEMAGAVKAGDVNRIFEHLSDRFAWNGLDKNGFRRWVETVKQNRWVDELTVFDFKFLDDRGRVEFRAKPKGRLPGDVAFYRVVAEFVNEGGQWKLKGFEVFNPFVDTDKPMGIPAFLS